MKTVDLDPSEVVAEKAQEENGAGRPRLFKTTLAEMSEVGGGRVMLQGSISIIISSLPCIFFQDPNPPRPDRDIA